MSKAGIHSNRGDTYQTLVAFECALKVLFDAAYDWIEIDSLSYAVDDVVVGRADGSLLAIQCKKNQPRFSCWTVGALKDELRKAAALLAQHPQAKVRFVSRSNFGDLQALCEAASIYPDELSYRSSLSLPHAIADDELKDLLSHSAASFSSHEFLGQLDFKVSSNFDDFKAELRERLEARVSNGDIAFKVLWSRLDDLGSRMPGDGGHAHRLSKADLEKVLRDAGVLFAPPLDIADTRAAFASVSAAGRSWNRTIGQERLPVAIVDEILAAIADRKQSVLLSGQPGSGKTCVMLNVVEQIEHLARGRTDLVSLFIQASEFATSASVEQREARGLPRDWVERAARAAGSMHVVVVIDSLDVLSIARDHEVLGYFLAQIARLASVPGVSVIASCRDFDRHYNRRIAHQQWDLELVCPPLDWDSHIAPLLERKDVAVSGIDDATRGLIRNPRELALFVELATRAATVNVVSNQELAKRYLAELVDGTPALGTEAMLAIEDLAAAMLKRRALAISLQAFKGTDDCRRTLLSLGVLHDTGKGELKFGHQSLLDVLVVSQAIRGGMSLNAFISGLDPVPFVRPSIRSFIAQLATGDRREYRKQVRAVLLSDKHAFHIRRLVAETFAEGMPHPDDWPLLRTVRQEQRALFQIIYAQARDPLWHPFWLQHLVGLLEASREQDALLTHAARVAQWYEHDPEGIIRYWQGLMNYEWIDQERVAHQLESILAHLPPVRADLLVPLLMQLLRQPRRKNGFLGAAIANCLIAGGGDDSLLWQYVAGEVLDMAPEGYMPAEKVHCFPHDFGEREATFFPDRVLHSPGLLDMAIALFTRWCSPGGDEYISRYSNPEPSLRHGPQSMLDVVLDKESSLDILRVVTARAILHHAARESDWWRERRFSLGASPVGYLRYCAVQACIAHPAANIDLAAVLLSDGDFLDKACGMDLAVLLQSLFPAFAPEQQDLVQAAIIRYYQKEDRAIPRMIVAIPACFRLPAAQRLADEYGKKDWPMHAFPDRTENHDNQQQLSADTVQQLGDTALLKLINHYKGYKRAWLQSDFGRDEGHVYRVMQDASSRCPLRFMRFLSQHREAIPAVFHTAILNGAATHFAAAAETPAPNMLAGLILDELEGHADHWAQWQVATRALKSCAELIDTPEGAARLILLAARYADVNQNTAVLGIAALDALVQLTVRWANLGLPLPAELEPAMIRFALSRPPEIQMSLLVRVADWPENLTPLARRLVGTVLERDGKIPWLAAEAWLHKHCVRQYEQLAPWLERLLIEGNGQELALWSHLAATAALAGKMAPDKLLDTLSALHSSYAWDGAAKVWSTSRNFLAYREQCLAGLARGFAAERPCAEIVASRFGNLFEQAGTSIPLELLSKYFSISAVQTGPAWRDVYGLDAWLNAAAQSDPWKALEMTEQYLAFAKRLPPFLDGRPNTYFAQLLTTLFADADEREEADGGDMMRRVVQVQNALLELGVRSVHTWLQHAERA